MSLELFSLILWIPFLLVFLSIGIPFCLKGFKKGIFHALVSTGATVVAAMISFFAAKLLAPMAINAIRSFLPEISVGENPLLESLLPSLIESAVTGFLALILFSVILLILVPVGKILFALIPVPKKKDLISRLLGMGLRLADGIVVTILLLLPIYGTLAAYGPTIEMVLDLTEQTAMQSERPAVVALAAGEKAPEELTIRDFVRCAVNHPVVAISRSAPVSAIYNELSTTSTTDGETSVPEMIQSITKTANTLQAFTSGDFSPEDLQALMELQDDVINSDWFYAVISSVAEEITSSLPELGEDAPVYLLAMEDLLNRPKDEFQQCCSGILDWFACASEKGLFQVMEDGSLDAQWIAQSGLLQKSVEVQSEMPEDFPFMDLIAEFFADYMAEKDENNLLTDNVPSV